MNIAVTSSITAHAVVAGTAKAHHAAHSGVSASSLVIASCKSHHAGVSGIVGHATCVGTGVAHHHAVSSVVGLAHLNAVGKAHHAAHSSFIGLAVVTATAKEHEVDYVNLGGGATFAPGTPTLTEALHSSLTAGSTFSIVMTLTSRIFNTPPQNVPIPIVRTVPQPPPLLNLQISATGQVKNPPLQTGVRVKLG